MTRPEPLDGARDPELERMLREALHARAEATEIRGDGLTRIRERTRGGSRSRGWLPVLAGVAAAAVVVGAAVVPQVLRSSDDTDAAASRDAATSVLSTPTAEASPSAPPSSATATPSTSPSVPPSAPQSSVTAPSAPIYTGTPLPIGEDTPLVYPFATSQAAADQMAVGGAGLPRDPDQVALAFVQEVTGRSGLGASSTTDTSAGILVQVSDPAVTTLTNVYVRPVVVPGAAVPVTYNVVGASRAGGDSADLTIDGPSGKDGTISVAGRWAAPLAGSGATLSVTALVETTSVAPDPSTTADADLSGAAGSKRWSATVEVPAGTSVAGLVAVARDTTGAVVAVVATTYA